MGKDLKYFNVRLFTDDIKAKVEMIKHLHSYIGVYNGGTLNGVKIDLRLRVTIGKTVYFDSDAVAAAENAVSIDRIVVLTNRYAFNWMMIGLEEWQHFKGKLYEVGPGVYDLYQKINYDEWLKETTHYTNSVKEKTDMIALELKEITKKQNMDVVRNKLKAVGSVIKNLSPLVPGVLFAVGVIAGQRMTHNQDIQKLSASLDDLRESIEDTNVRLDDVGSRPIEIIVDRYDNYVDSDYYY